VYPPSDLLSLIRQDERLATLLRASFDFDVSRVDRSEAVQLSSGQQLESVAGDFTGGRFYLCGRLGLERPVLYASSEGQAGLIANNLRDALEIIVELPYWRDCLTYSGGGDLEVMTTVAGYLQRDLIEENPEIGLRQSQAIESLLLDVVPVDILLNRLHSAVLRSTPDYVFTDETGEYEGLFGDFLPERNPRWR
jgi:hypothetical protein